MNSLIKNKIIQHLRNCTNNMIENEELKIKSNCLNIASELIASVLFFEDDKKLHALHFTLNVINNTVLGLIQENEKIPMLYFIKMADYLNLIADRIDTESDYSSILTDMMSLTFSITSFGSYFYEK